MRYNSKVTQIGPGSATNTVILGLTTVKEWLWNILHVLSPNAKSGCT